MTSEKPNLDLLAPAPIIFGVPFILGVILHFVFGSVRLGLPEYVAIPVGVALFLVSIALGAWSLRTMFGSGEHPDPRHSTSVLVDTGPFAHSRNPIYVSFVLGGVGIAVGLNSVFILAAAGIGALAIDRLVIAHEEQYLYELFGDAFQQYRSRVRRWI